MSKINKPLLYFLIPFAVLTIYLGKVQYDSMQCHLNFSRGIWENVYDGYAQTLSKNIDMEELGKAVENNNRFYHGIPSLAICPVCKKPYVYHPFEGEVDRMAPEPRVIAWCPEPCHWGGRFVLLETGRSCWLPENEFQESLKLGHLKKEYINYDYPPGTGIVVFLAFTWFFIFIVTGIWGIVYLSRRCISKLKKK